MIDGTTGKIGVPPASRNRRRHRIPATAPRLVVWVIALNAPFWLLAQGFFVSRALVSMDSLLALLVLQFSATLGVALLVLSWLCDLLVTTSLTFHFASPVDLVRAFRFAGTVNPLPYLASPKMLFAAPFALVAFAVVKLRPNGIGPVPILVSLVILLTLDVANGSSAMSRLAVRWSETNLAGSSFFAVASALRDARSTDATVISVPGGKAEFDRLLPSAASGGHGVLFVIVESMGVHKSPAVQAWLAKQLVPADVSDRYVLSSGTVAFRGGTPDGELRRLCGWAGSYRNITAESGEHCLPKILARAGWRTIGFHGFSETMFDRRRWWPLIGLQDVHFAEQLGGIHVKRCGAAFKGLCDADVIATATRAASEPRTFVYVLTLNSHLPLAQTTFPADLASLCANAHLGDDACTLLARIGVTLRAIAQQLASVEGVSSVMVVGDHAPPFLDRRSRDQFLSDQVPYYTLTANSSASSVLVAPRSDAHDASGRARSGSTLPLSSTH